MTSESEVTFSGSWEPIFKVLGNIETEKRVFETTRSNNYSLRFRRTDIKRLGTIKIINTYLKKLW